jgi:peroxiredoxin (alkyl hydroperoxide reductase subunit C)
MNTRRAPLENTVLTARVVEEYREDHPGMIIGETISDYSLQAFHEESIKQINLSDYRGKWLVLIFYPGDFTFVCPTELYEAAELYAEFQKLKGEILSVSTDSVFVHKAWHDTSPLIKKITYPMVADPTGRLCREFGTYLEEEGVALRGTFLVDPDGVLKTMEIHDNSIGRSMHELLRKLQAAIYVRDHQGEVCPASWAPGEKTLAPSLDLVGKL